MKSATQRVFIFGDLRGPIYHGKYVHPGHCHRAFKVLFLRNVASNFLIHLRQCFIALTPTLPTLLQNKIWLWNKRICVSFCVVLCSDNVRLTMTMTMKFWQFQALFENNLILRHTHGTNHIRVTWQMLKCYDFLGYCITTLLVFD